MKRTLRVLNAPKWLMAITLGYAAVLAGLTVLNWLGAERLWLGALNLYLPQVMWAAPGFLLAPLFFKYDRPLAWLPVACVLWVLGPIMDFSWPLPAARSTPAGVPLRVMTWNIKYGYHDLAPLLVELERRKPDVVLFQDAIGCLNGPLGEYFKGWEVRSSGQYLIASRYPLSQADVHRLPTSSRKEENFLKCRVRVGNAVVTLYNVHLKTPRRSLNALRKARHQPWSLPEAIDYFNSNVSLRVVQATAMLESLRGERGPVVVAGDLNAPESSLVCSVLRDAGLENAFSKRGLGYGFTYGHFLLKNRLPWLKVSWMRIDHIMVSSGITTRNCLTGTGQASDHRPVVADLLVEQPLEKSSFAKATAD